MKKRKKCRTGGEMKKRWMEKERKEEEERKEEKEDEGKRKEL